MSGALDWTSWDCIRQKTHSALCIMSHSCPPTYEYDTDCDDDDRTHHGLLSNFKCKDERSIIIVKCANGWLSGLHCCSALLCSSLSRGGCLAYFSFVYLPLASSSCCWLSTLVYWFISQVGGMEEVRAHWVGIHRNIGNLRLF